jgi:hypothetical protein
MKFKRCLLLLSAYLAFTQSGTLKAQQNPPNELGGWRTLKRIRSPSISRQVRYLHRNIFRPHITFSGCRTLRFSEGCVLARRAPLGASAHCQFRHGQANHAAACPLVQSYNLSFFLGVNS